VWPSRRCGSLGRPLSMPSGPTENSGNLPSPRHSFTSDLHGLPVV
jgi:hypothetical protein